MVNAAARALMAVLATAVFDTAQAEAVTFPGDGFTLRAELFRPAGAGPFPAVVALHGCAGLYGKNGALSPRHLDWAERLSGQGFLVLLPDSFGSRGEESQCRKDIRTVRASRERIGDALDAKAYLQSRSDVKADAVSLLGWSNGGSTVLYTLRSAAKSDDARSFGKAIMPFAKAVAFYPGCRTPLERGNWHTRTPLLILIGEADDWTPAEPCRTLTDEAKAAGEQVDLITYPGAYHDFDHPDLTVRTHKGLAFTANGDGVAHTGTNPEARADAIRRVPQFLAR